MSKVNLSVDPLSGAKLEECYATYLERSENNVHQHMFAHMKESFVEFSGRPVDFLSIGAGEGVLENIIVKETPLELNSFYGVEAIEEHRKILHEVVHQWKIPKVWIDANLFNAEFNVLQEATNKFDIVLLSHLLYCVQDPMTVLKHALTFRKPGGKLIVCHTTEGGFPGFWKRFHGYYDITWKGGKPSVDHGLSAEDICKWAQSQGIKWTMSKRETRLNISEIIDHKQPVMDNLLSFYLQCDVGKLGEDVKSKLVEFIKEFSTLEKDGCWYFHDNEGFIEFVMD